MHTLEPATAHHGLSPHLVTVITVLIVPMFATFVMEAVECLIESLGWRIRLGRSGWDLCVLAVGLTGGIFTLPQVVDKWGAESAVLLGIICLLVSFACGVFIVHLRKTDPTQVRGWQSFLAVGLGLAALAMPWYFVLTS